MRACFSLVALLALLAACSRATSAPIEVVPGQSIQLAERQSARVSDSAVLVQFMGANDSRCPADVVCVWAGEAAVALWFSGAGSERADTLHLVMKRNAVTYGGYLFEAADLQPYPRSQEQNAPKTLTLRVSRLPGA